MKSLTRLLLSSAGALVFGAVNAAKSAYSSAPREAFAPTKRKPNIKPKRKVASVKRQQQREAARAVLEKRIMKEREIGVDPIYLNLPRIQKEGLRKSWLGKSATWDRAHG